MGLCVMRALSRASAGRLCPRRLRLGARGFSADVSAAPTASAPQITHEELRDVARTFVEQEINPHVLTSGRRPACITVVRYSLHTCLEPFLCFDARIAHPHARSSAGGAHDR